MRMHPLGLAGSLLLLSVVAIAEEPRIESAKRLFDDYVALEHRFDSSIADLYADEASIRNTRKYPFGLPTKVMTLPAMSYKALIRQAMPMAKARGDRSRYSEVSYSMEGDKVRINCIRYSELKKYFSPFSILAGPGADGKWLIYEEISESRSANSLQVMITLIVLLIIPAGAAIAIRRLLKKRIPRPTSAQ